MLCWVFVVPSKLDAREDFSRLRFVLAGLSRQAIPGQSLRHVQWTKLQMEMFFEYLRLFSVSIIEPMLHTRSFIDHRRCVNLETGSGVERHT